MYAKKPGTVILMSGEDLDSSRYHILAADPWLRFSAYRRRNKIVIRDQVFEFQANPFDTLKMLLKQFELNHSDLPDLPDLPDPIAAGLFGYLSYDLKDHLEILPRTAMDPFLLPQMLLFGPSFILIHDKHTSTTRLGVVEFESDDKKNFRHTLKSVKESISSISDIPISGKFYGRARGFRSNFIRADYIQAVEKIKDYITKGDVYQVNLSQQFQMDFSGDAFGLYQALYHRNPAPFFAYIHGGDHHIISTSPERFIRLENRHIETRPIKGTRPRGNTPESDEALKRELEASKKDDAELSMIVDLLRNDIGKVCEAGSVHVSHHKKLEAYENVYHLVSIVEGTMDIEKDAVDLICAVFPGGSITGCPKIRAMEIIDELEPSRRHIYTGGIGYISFHGTMDLSIAIRTAVILNHKIIFSVGGGIVFDSNPGDEFDETLHKGQTLMRVFVGKETIPDDEIYVWKNGALELQPDSMIPTDTLGFQYGFGFFETIRTDNGKVILLEEHIKRFNHTWAAFFSDAPPDLTWDPIIHMVLEKNHLSNTTAAVKIIATKGDPTDFPRNDTVLVTTRPYIPRLAELGVDGLSLAIYPEPRQTPLADYKTLNYLYYFLAGQWAKSKGANEAIICNPDGTVSETNTGNILILTGNHVITPVSPHVLPGVMETAVLQQLEKRGYNHIRKPVTPDILTAEDHVLMITNSLMGAVPVVRIDEKKLSPASTLCGSINNHIFGGEW
jgi:para-aminobenzoate synthetase component 1